VCVDNFFTSPALFRQLLLRQTYACGTLQTTRKGAPKSLDDKLAGKERGTAAWLTNNGLCATSWLDKEPVHFLSSVHQPGVSPAVVVRFGELD
jgi:hypothetical protein